VDSQTSVLGESVSNPVGTKPVFRYDDDPAIVVEVADRDSLAPPDRLPNVSMTSAFFRV